jgi:hypothetical protein
MPLGQYAEQGILGLYFGGVAFASAGTLYCGLVLQLGQLSTALTAGATVSTLACASVTTGYQVNSGDVILVGTGSTTQAFNTSTTGAAGQTSLTITGSPIANATYAIGTPFIRCNAFLAAQEPTIGTGAYARVSITNSTANWNTSSGLDPATVTNKTAITFPTATASWGTVAGFLISDSLSSTTNMWAFGMLNASQVISSGNTPSFAAAALTVSLV